MPLPTRIDEQIRKRFEELIAEGQKIIKQMEVDNADFHSKPHYLGGLGPVTYVGSVHYQDTNYESLVTRVISLVHMVLGKSERGRQVAEDIRSLSSGTTAMERIVGILQGLKDDYEHGMLDDLSQMIEANIASDYMGQAEQLLGEGVPGQYDHVPAAVLAGAVLEDALHRLCQRQTPPIALVNANGDPKTLDPLITDLQKANVFNKAKADMLRSWAKTRNYAAHGEFGQFKRSDVESMIVGVKAFLADYL
jgi:hypothetical protein